MPTVRTVRLVNPHKRKSRKSSGARRPKRKRNMGGGELLIMTNPKKRSSRSSRRRRSRNRKHRNPSVRQVRRNHSFRRRRRNPSIGGFSSSELLKLGLGAAGGAIGARYLTQLALGDKNTGPMGYGANIAAALALAWVAAKYAGRDIAAGVAAGGISAVILRLWSEQVSKTSPAALSGYLGDLDFSNDGLGAYIDSGFPLPTQSSTQGNYLVVPPNGPQLVHASQGSAAPQVNVQPAVPSGLSRFASRF